MVSLKTAETSLSDADKELLTLIGSAKRMRIDQAARRMGEDLAKVRKQVSRLESEGWLEHTVILDKDEGLLTLWPSGGGLEVVGLRQSLYRGKPALANIPHDFSLVEIGLALLEEDPEGEFVPERLVPETFGFGRTLVETEEWGERRSHRPDGVFKCSDGSIIIVECETSTKARDLREWMMLQNEGYVTEGGYTGVTRYYGMTPEARARLQRTQEQRHLQRVEILEVPGEVLWRAGSHIAR
jgi:hypothetical protein